MTASATPVRTGAPAAVVLLAASVVVAAALAILAAAAHAAGADRGYPPLMPAVFLPFGVGGLLAGFGGWLLVRRIAFRPARLLRVLVPTMLVLSWLPDLIVAPGIPGADPTGVLALALMHVVVVAVGVPVYRRVAPVE